MEAKGAKFLKVTGILMIIGGAISIISSIIAVLGIAALVALGAGAIMPVLLYVAGIFSLVAAVAQLIAGIIGVKNAKKPEMAKKCMAWGIIVAVLCVLGCILTVAGGNAFPTMSLILGLVLPVLYIIGAAKNKAA